MISTKHRICVLASEFIAAQKSEFLCSRKSHVIKSTPNHFFVLKTYFYWLIYCENAILEHIYCERTAQFSILIMCVALCMLKNAQINEGNVVAGYLGQGFFYVLCIFIFCNLFRVVQCSNKNILLAARITSTQIMRSLKSSVNNSFYRISK